MPRVSFTVPKLQEVGAWGDVTDRFPGGSYGNRNIANVRLVALHHTVTQPTGNAMADLETIARIHNGAIPYDVVVTSEYVNGYAKTYYTGDLGTIRAKNPNRKGAFGLPANYGNLHVNAVAMIGRFDGNYGNPSVEMCRSVKAVAEEWIFNEDQRFPGIYNTWDSFVAHKDLDYTACPGEIQNFRDAIINVPPVNDARPEPEPTRWQDTDFRPETHTFVVKGDRIEVKDFDTLDVKAVLVHGQEVEMSYVSNDNRWYASQWALDSNHRHGVLIEDVERDQLVVSETKESSVASVETPSEHIQDDGGEPAEPIATTVEEVIVDMPVDAVITTTPPQPERSTAKEATSTIGKFLVPSMAGATALLTAFQQFIDSIPPQYLLIVLAIAVNVGLVVLYKRWPWLNERVNKLLEKLKLR